MSAPRRSSRQSTPTSPPPSTRKATLPVSSSTPSFSSLAPPSASRATRASSPLSSRPPLPVDHRNTLLDNYTGKIHPIKIQLLKLGNGANDTIKIARVKCPVPKGTPGHIIKRFDTDAVSASSLFRAAYPTATDKEELTEMKWITKGKYGDTKKAGLEEDETHKLSGTWIPVAHASTLANEYGLLKFASDLITFKASDEPVIADSDIDSPARSPAAKRVRVNSPPAAGTTRRGGAMGISQSLEETAPKSKPSTPAKVAAAAASKMEKEIKESKLLVETMKSTQVVSIEIPSKKRTLVVDEEDVPLPTSGTLADVLPADKRGFFGKMFRKAPKKVPVNAGREIKPAGSQIALLEANPVEGRRWLPGVGLVLAIGLTATAPYLFG